MTPTMGQVLNADNSNGQTTGRYFINTVEPEARANHVKDVPPVVESFIICRWAEFVK
jgi:hypothetical protein